MMMRRCPFGLKNLRIPHGSRHMLEASGKLWHPVEQHLAYVGGVLGAGGVQLLLMCLSIPICCTCISSVSAANVEELSQVRGDFEVVVWGFPRHCGEERLNTSTLPNPKFPAGLSRCLSHQFSFFGFLPFNQSPRLRLIFLSRAR